MSLRQTISRSGSSSVLKYTLALLFVIVVSQSSSALSQSASQNTKPISAPTAHETQDKHKHGPYAHDAVVHYNRGVEFHQAGELDQAIAEYQAAIAAVARLSEAWSNLGGIYMATKSYARVIDLLQKLRNVEEQRSGPDAPVLALTIDELAYVYCLQENYAAAEPLYQRALTLTEKERGPDYQRTVNGYAALFRATKRPAEADALEAHARPIRKLTN